MGAPVPTTYDHEVGGVHVRVASFFTDKTAEDAYVRSALRMAGATYPSPPWHLNRFVEQHRNVVVEWADYVHPDYSRRSSSAASAPPRPMWGTDWNEAAKHPWRTVAFLSLGGLVGGVAIGYWRFDHSLVWAAVLGVTFALILARAGWRYSHDPDLPRRQAERRRTQRFGSDTIWMGIGGGLVLVGAVERNPHVVLAGLAPIALGLGLRFLRRLPPRR